MNDRKTYAVVVEGLGAIYNGFSRTNATMAFNNAQRADSAATIMMVCDGIVIQQTARELVPQKKELA